MTKKTRLLILTAVLALLKVGAHDMVGEKLVVSFGNVQQSYLGPPETKGK